MNFSSSLFILKDDGNKRDTERVLNAVFSSSSSFSLNTHLLIEEASQKNVILKRELSRYEHLIEEEERRRRQGRRRKTYPRYLLLFFLRFNYFFFLLENRHILMSLLVFHHLNINFNSHISIVTVELCSFPNRISLKTERIF